MIAGFDPGNPRAAPTIAQMLRSYADALTPWAMATAQRMIDEVNVRDLRNWREVGELMSASMKREILSAPTGEVTRALLAVQVDLIKSIPIEAAERVQKLALRSVEEGGRAKEVAEEILRSGEVAKSRAMTIARTEVSRAQSTFTQARAEYAGSEGYIWRTSGDGDVRASHRAMSGKYVRWNAPPTLDGMTGHAGCLPNCRCYAEPVLPD